MTPGRLEKILTALAARYDPITPEPLNGPFEMIVWEAVAYLQPDERRREAFEMLRARVGLTPAAIRSASLRTLREITRHGGSIAHEDRADRLKTSAELARAWNDRLDDALKLPLPMAKKALMEYPMIGEPGAEKILLFTRAHPVLALDSNGVRTMVRLGLGEEKKSYSATYRSVREATLDEAPHDCDSLIQAHLLLRRHGQEVCRRSAPVCVACAVTQHCHWYRDRVAVRP